MHKTLIILPLLVCSTPTLAQHGPQLPPELTDPASAQKLANAMQALSGAFLDVKVGGVEAALQGREATPQEKNLTVGDLARRRDPEFDRRFQQQMATLGPRMHQSVRALNQALPEIMQSLGDVQKSIERAVANMPDPAYPKR